MSVASGCSTDGHPRRTSFFVIVSSAKWTTLPASAGTWIRGGYPRPGQTLGYSAALSAHRRGHASISRYVVTVISAGGFGQVEGGSVVQMTDVTGASRLSSPLADLANKTRGGARKVSANHEFVDQDDRQGR